VSSDDKPKVSWLRRITIGRNRRVTLIRGTILAILTVIAFKLSVLPVRVTGISMLPNYRDGEAHYIYRLAYRKHDPQRGDVVAVRFAGPSIMLLKRVVGLPGERIGFSTGHVTVNGQSLDEPYPLWPSNWEREPVELAPDEFFVVGDNRTMPMKDHTFGIAKRERIMGKLML